ncbi:MAG: UDP-N-acetylglucosamine 1-carboxyvinyltransferase [Lachnospiraceae bacterium]|nr:UDP-N-acetylglucosamine 1-carboxyvinyltransferase [Lachnospiraceae bacterium]
MASLKISGGNPLYGKLPVQGSKNAVLPMMAAALLLPGETQLAGCPHISDVEAMAEVLRACGASVVWQDSVLCIDASNVFPADIPAESTRRTRACVLLLGALLARCRRAVMARPGGCAIGERPIDLHLYALRRLGADIMGAGEKEELLCCEAERLTGGEISFRFPSVGATQNAILAAVLAKGTTRIHNAAAEPEVTWLCRFLNRAGAGIAGAGTQHLEIEGGRPLHAVSFEVPPDRIVAGTYLAAVLAAGGEVLLQRVCAEELSSVTEVLSAAGGLLRRTEEGLLVKKNGRLRAFDYLCTAPYPGFPTDMQSQLLALAACADGTTVLEEKIFEARFHIVDEFIRMGADIYVEESCAIVNGVRALHGERVEARDLRGAAALVVGALAAEGTTVIAGAEYIRRGYEDIVGDLSRLGAVLSAEEGG